MLNPTDVMLSAEICLYAKLQNKGSLAGEQDLIFPDLLDLLVLLGLGADVCSPLGMWSKRSGLFPHDAHNISGHRYEVLKQW